MATRALRHREQRLGGRIVQIDGVFVLHVELHQPERVLGPWLLHDPAVLPDHVVGLEIARPLGRDLLFLDRARHRPGRVGDEAEHGGAKLRRFRVRLAHHHAAAVDQLAVTPIAEPRGGDVHVDAGRRRAAFEPAQPLHVHRDRAGAHVIGLVEDRQRLRADHAIRFHPVIGLHLLHGGDHRRGVAITLRGAGIEIVERGELARDVRHPRIGAARLDGVAGVGNGGLRLRRLLAQFQIHL